MAQTMPQAFMANFLGQAPQWYKQDDHRLFDFESHSSLHCRPLRNRAGY